MTWQPYNLDQEAQRLVLEFCKLEGVIVQSHKMRTTVAFGLERFWGEHLRLIHKKDQKEQNQGKYWREVWNTFASIMRPTGIVLPDEEINGKGIEKINETAKLLWNLSIEDQRVCLAVLTQLCDSLVWWTQRYKVPGGKND